MEIESQSALLAQAQRVVSQAPADDFVHSLNLMVFEQVLLLAELVQDADVVDLDLGAGSVFALHQAEVDDLVEIL